MNPTTQKWLVTGLAGLITSGLSRLLADAFSNETPPPERRSLADDTREAVFHGVVSIVAVVLASAIIRWLSAQR